MAQVIREICLQNLLSFGPETKPLKLGALNVLIGPNGSGKSNFLEAIGLLQAAPKELAAPIRGTGGLRDWLWQGEKNPIATIAAVIENTRKPDMPIRHEISFWEYGQRFQIVAEKIENEYPFTGRVRPRFYYRNEGGRIRLAEGQEPREEQAREERPLGIEAINPEESVLSQVKNPELYPILAYLSNLYGRFRLYREWSFGRSTMPRMPQKADLSSEYLSEGGETLAHVLNAIRPKARNELLERLSYLYPGVRDFNVQFPAGWVQLFLEEDGFSIPATRLSDGTLRYLCLLAILCHPNPPPVVCIEEPELGLHPDVLPKIAEMLIGASDRCQLIVTTHSDRLVDELTNVAESVIVCEKHQGATVMERLDSEKIKCWLEKYSLGELWTKGEIGGTRW